MFSDFAQRNDISIRLNKKNIEHGELTNSTKTLSDYGIRTLAGITQSTIDNRSVKTFSDYKGKKQLELSLESSESGSKTQMNGKIKQVTNQHIPNSIKNIEKSLEYKINDQNENSNNVEISKIISGRTKSIEKSS